MSHFSALLLFLAFQANATGPKLQDRVEAECRETVKDFETKILLPKSVRGKNRRLSNFGTILSDMRNLKEAYCGLSTLRMENLSRNESMGGGEERFSAAGEAAELGKKEVWDLLCKKNKEFISFEAQRKLNDMRHLCVHGLNPPIRARDVQDHFKELRELGGIKDPSIWINPEYDQRFLPSVAFICRSPKLNPCASISMRKPRGQKKE